MKQKTKQLIMTLALLITAVTGAWATDYTTLAVGDVIKVGDTFTPTADGAFNSMGVYSGVTYTLMRADVDNDYNVTEKTDGAYYVFKFVSEIFPYMHFDKAFAVTAISDGLEVTNIETIKGKLSYTLVLHESASPSGPVAINWDATAKTATIAAMPAGNVTVNVEYWPGMLTLPAASEGGTVTLEGVTNNTIIDENFDDYTAGGKMAQTANAAGNSNWTTWSNEPGTGEDGTLATLDDNTCLQVTTDNDQVLLLGDLTSGMWEYSLDVYVPEGKFGYFNLLHDFAGPNSTWALQCYFNAYNDGQNTQYYPGHGTVHAGSDNTADLPCVVNEWMHVRVVIDIDNDLAKLYFNGQFICEWKWSLDSYGDDSEYGGKLAACNIYGEDDEFYVDNIKLTQISALPAGFERDGDGNIYVESGTQFTLVTTPAENYHLASLSDGTNTYDVDDDGKVTITMPDADLTLTAEFAENTFDVSLNKTDLAEGEPALWKAKSTNVAEVTLGTNDLKGVKKSETVTVTYTGTKKIIGVKAEKKAAAAPRPLAEAVAADLGKIAGADGNIYDTKAAAEAAGTTAVAKVCYVDGNGHGLALALTDEEGLMNWSTAQTTCAAHTAPFTGGTWKLASKDEWSNMISAAGSYSALRDGFSSVGGTNMQSGNYWSSTESGSSNAWDYLFDFGVWYADDKGGGSHVRACLAF